jgi:hypothetical protein
MLPLADLERQLAASLFRDETDIAAAVETRGMSAAARVDIHRNHVQRSLTKVLETTFAAVASLTDARFFSWLAHEFIMQSPPTSPCLFEYGEEFPNFIDGFPACVSLPYLADVARLEWAIHSVFHAGDDTAAVVLLESRFPVHQIWRAALDPDAPGVDLQSGPAHLRIYRADGDASFELIHPDQFHALSQHG